MRIKNYLFWLMAIVYSLLIFYLSHQSKPIKEMEFIWNFDKIAHIVEYSIFSFLWWKALRTVDKGQAFHDKIIFVWGALFAASDEIHQGFIPGRQASIWDWAADIIGVLLTLYFLTNNEKNRI